MKGWAMRCAAVVAAMLFFAAAALQYNDPDPVRWMALYGSGAVICVLALFGHAPRRLAGALALIALAWAVTLAPRVVGHVRPAEMFSSVSMMMSPAVEEAREMTGLLLVAGTMALLILGNAVKKREEA